MRSHHASRHATVLLTVVHKLLYLLGLVANSSAIQLCIWCSGLKYGIDLTGIGPTIFILMVGERPAYRHIRP